MWKLKKFRSVLITLLFLGVDFEMKLVKIQSDFINQLRSIDSKVRTKKERPYIGIVLKVNNLDYFAPLASPKPKHKTMKSNIDLIKIDKGNLGVIDLENMIPIPSSEVIHFDFNDCNEKERTLLTNQHREISKIEKTIHENSNKVYTYCENKKEPFYSRCVNFKKIEDVVLENYSITENEKNYEESIKGLLKSMSSSINIHESIDERKNELER
uniref:type III toxin-antitoxin system ToxN/AbiQ family toxin n=1 Tax=Brochothrix campestris TaxID=2757 RepID=UPI003D56515A